MNYLEMPYIPYRKVGTVLLDYRADKEIVNELESFGIEVLKTCRCPELYESIDGHADIHLHHVSANKIIVAPNVFSYYNELLGKKGFAVVKGDTWLHRNYPGNIAYNVLRIANLALHNTKYTDEKIKLEFEKDGIELIHVNQGYTKCSVCILDSKTAITSDNKIQKILEKKGIDSLLIEPGGIVLQGLNYGFIGGSTGLLDNNIIAITGKIANIKEYKRILEFINQKGFTVKELRNKQIIDVGSIVPLNY